MLDVIKFTKNVIHVTTTRHKRNKHTHILPYATGFLRLLTTKGPAELGKIRNWNPNPKKARVL